MRLESREFLELVQTLPQLTYVFVALGSDTRNIEAAVRLPGAVPAPGSPPLYSGGGAGPLQDGGSHLRPPTTGAPPTTFIF